mgnify:CR=1 FL=1
MKKTIQRVLAAVILFAMILSGGFSEVGKVHAEKQQGTTKRAIYVVFDNSGSMYGDGNKAWSQATYAMEVFAAMMNYESGDVMKVFPMISQQMGIRGLQQSHPWRFVEKMILHRSIICIHQSQAELRIRR